MEVELWIALPLLAAGLFFFAAGTAALLRFPDVLSRLHGVTKADNLGLGLTVLGLLPLAGSLFAAGKMILSWLIVLASGAVVAQLIGAAELRRREERP